jgi:hypothetical protein
MEDQLDAQLADEQSQSTTITTAFERIVSSAIVPDQAFARTAPFDTSVPASSPNGTLHTHNRNIHTFTRGSQKPVTQHIHVVERCLAANHIT